MSKKCELQLRLQNIALVQWLFGFVERPDTTNQCSDIHLQSTEQTVYHGVRCMAFFFHTRPRSSMNESCWPLLPCLTECYATYGGARERERELCKRERCARERERERELCPSTFSSLELDQSGYRSDPSVKPWPWDKDRSLTLVKVLLSRDGSTKDCVTGESIPLSHCPHLFGLLNHPSVELTVWNFCVDFGCLVWRLPEDTISQWWSGSFQRTPWHLPNGDQETLLSCLPPTPTPCKHYAGSAVFNILKLAA